MMNHAATALGIPFVSQAQRELVLATRAFMELWPPQARLHVLRSAALRYLDANRMALRTYSDCSPS